MIFSEYKKRNIYPQSGIFNFGVDIQLNNLTGISSFGFSGEDLINFTLSSGQIYLNNSSNLFLSSYSINENINISGNIGSNSLDIWINNQPYILGLNKNTGYYNYFYVNSTNVETDLSLKIYGDSPDYSYNPFESYYSGQIIPIQIVNSGSFPFKIFSGEVLYNSNFSLSGVNNIDVTGSKTLNLIANNFSPTEQEIPINLYTNFGEISLLFSASGIPLESGQFYLFFGPDNKTIVSQIPNNYIVTVKSYSGIYLITSLEYVSGITGDYYKNILNVGTGEGQVSGFVEGSGEIYNFSGTGEISSINPITNLPEYGTGTGIYKDYIIASGDVSGEFSITMLGKGSGLIEMIAPITGTGEFLFQGTIGPNGGFLTRSDLSGWGSGINEYGLYLGYTTSGVGTVFVPYTGSNEITGVFSPSQYETITYISDLFYFTGNIEKFYLISGLAWATGGIITGQLLGEFGYNYEPGIYTFSKGWTGVGSGFSAILDSFDPVLFSFERTGTSGLIGGIYYTGFNSQGCTFEEPFFIPTGIPSIIYNSSGNIVNPLDIFVLTPLNTGEYTGDNSNNINSRTNISRRGDTPSGNGYFDQVFQQPFYENGIWTETLEGYNQVVTNNKTGIIKNISATPYLYNDIISGTFKVSGNYTGYQSFIWNGKVTGNFNDYSTIISGISNPSIYKMYSSSYNFEMLLKTGTYAFFILPYSGSSTESPTVLYPTNIIVPTLQTSIQIPFQLSTTTDSEVTLKLKYLDGTARNGIDYSGVTNQIVFYNGLEQIQYLNIPLLNINANYDSFFNIKIEEVNGGYISNKNDILNSPININIEAPNTNEDNNCCNPIVQSGTGCGLYEVKNCQNLLGNQLWSEGNGVFSYTTNLLQPIPVNNSLVFRLYFSGINDRLIMKAYTTDNSPITFFDNVNSIGLDTPYIFNTGIMLPSKTYAIYAEVQGGYLRANSLRPNWSLSLTCDIDSCGNPYQLPTACQSGDFFIITQGFDGDYIGGTPYLANMANYRFNQLSDFVDGQFCRRPTFCNGVFGNQSIVSGEGNNSKTYLNYGIAADSFAQSIVFIKNIREDYPNLSQYNLSFNAGRNSIFSVPSTGLYPIYFYIDAYAITDGGSGFTTVLGSPVNVPSYYTGRYGYSGYEPFVSIRNMYVPSGAVLKYSVQGMKLVPDYTPFDACGSGQSGFFNTVINKNGGSITTIL